jgi:hypothetical protein
MSQSSGAKSGNWLGPFFQSERHQSNGHHVTSQAKDRSSKEEARTKERGPEGRVEAAAKGHS